MVKVWEMQELHRPPPPITNKHGPTVLYNCRRLSWGGTRYSAMCPPPDPSSAQAARFWRTAQPGTSWQPVELPLRLRKRGLAWDVHRHHRLVSQLPTLYHGQGQQAICSGDRPFQPVASAMYIVHADILGLLPTSSEGYSCLLTLMDRTARWLEAVPVKKVEAASCTYIFLSARNSRFGVPVVVTTDRKAQFTSRMWTGHPFDTSWVPNTAQPWLSTRKAILLWSKAMASWKMLCGPV